MASDFLRSKHRGARTRATLAGRRDGRRLNPLALETPQDRERLERRLWVLEWGVVVAVTSLLLGFWQLQAVQSAQYRAQADANRLEQFRLPPARGLILDRNGVVLAENRPAYAVAVVREDIDDLAVELTWLASALAQPVEEITARLERYRNWPRFRPVVIADDVAQSTVIRIEARRREHPGVVVQVLPRRDYPDGASAAHLLGYVGEITSDQLQAWAGDYRMGDIVGQSGLERMYTDELAGSSGWRRAVVNSIGREMVTLEEEPPHPGLNVQLTLDSQLQGRIVELMEGRRGAVVVLGVDTGDVLALVSVPAFDPNSFAARFTQQQWTELSEDPAKPLRNRALAAELPPGSIFKLVMATAGLEEGVISRSSTFFCPGGKQAYGRFYNCLGHHGSVNVVEAIAQSCNTFFYELGMKLGREKIVRWAQAFGLGTATGIDLPQENGGIVPSDEWLASRGLRFYPGETVSLAIGQGRLAVSPLQLAHLAATGVTGFRIQPHLLLGVEDSSFGGQGRAPAVTPRAAEFSEQTRRMLLEGMTASVARGTSRRAGNAYLSIGGKTGTAQVAAASRAGETFESTPEHLRDHAWFVGVAPADNPQVAIAVYLEHGGSGGREAVPLGGQILAEYFGVSPAQLELEALTPDLETVGTGDPAAQVETAGPSATAAQRRQQQ